MSGAADEEGGPEQPQQQQESAAAWAKRQLESIPPGTRIVCGVVLAFGVLSLAVPQSPSFFALNVGYILPPFLRVWTPFTAVFFEASLFTALVDAVCVALLGRTLEPVWGSAELLRFVGVVAACCSAGACVALAAAAASSSSSPASKAAYYETDVCGMTGVLAGFLVALTQYAPESEHSLPLCGVVLRTRHFPALALAAAALLGVLLGWAPLLLCALGLCASWGYLRFFQPHSGGGGLRGDAAFGARVFVPDFARPLFDALDQRLRRRRGGARAVGSAASAAGVDLEAAVAGRPEDQERRRKMALRAIDQRMQQQQQQQQQQQPAASAQQLPPASP